MNPDMLAQKHRCDDKVLNEAGDWGEYGDTATESLLPAIIGVATEAQGKLRLPFPPPGGRGMPIAFESNEQPLQKLRERLRKMSDDELIKFGKDVRRLSEPRVSVTPDPCRSTPISSRRTCKEIVKRPR